MEADLLAGRHAVLVGRAATARHAASHAGATCRAADACAVSLRAAGRGARGVPCRPRGAGRDRAPARTAPAATARGDPAATTSSSSCAPWYRAAGRTRRRDGAAARRPAARARPARRLWDRACDGTGALVVVDRGAGMGKTRLAAELAEEAHGTAPPCSTPPAPVRRDAALSALRGHVRRRGRRCSSCDDARPSAGDDLVAELDELRPSLPRSRLADRNERGRGRPRPPRADGVDTLEPLDARPSVPSLSRYTPAHGAGTFPPTGCSMTAAASRAASTSSRAIGRAREAARRVGAVAGRAAAGRAELRSSEAELAGSVLELQAARSGSRRWTDHEGRWSVPSRAWRPSRSPTRRTSSAASDSSRSWWRGSVGAPLLGVVGPSGSGKSSVVRAGLLPALADGVLPGSEDGRRSVIRPGEHPLRELSAALAGSARAWFVLAVDQFEETFTACRDEQRPSRIHRRARAEAREGDERGIVLLAVRADYYGRCAAYPELSRAAGRQPRAGRGDAARRAAPGHRGPGAASWAARRCRARRCAGGRRRATNPARCRCCRRLCSSSGSGATVAACAMPTTSARAAFADAVARLAEEAFCELDPHAADPRAQRVAAARRARRTAARSSVGASRWRSSRPSDRGRRRVVGAAHRPPAAHRERRHDRDRPRSTAARVAAAARVDRAGPRGPADPRGA